MIGLTCAPQFCTSEMLSPCPHSSCEKWIHAQTWMTSTWAVPACLQDFFFFAGLGSILAKQALGPHFQSILLWLFWRWALSNYLPRLVSNHSPSNLNLPSNRDYRHEPPAPKKELDLKGTAWGSGIIQLNWNGRAPTPAYLLRRAQTASRGRAPALQIQSPKLKPQSHTYTKELHREYVYFYVWRILPYTKVWGISWNSRHERIISVQKEKKLPMW
jgi:hypothetical protein